MQLTEKEQSVIKELQTQEKSCVEKYRFYESSAKDPELQKLFHQIGDEEQEHFDSLADVLKGNVPNVKAQESGTQGYMPVGYPVDSEWIRSFLICSLEFSPYKILQVVF